MKTTVAPWLGEPCSFRVCGRQPKFQRCPEYAGRIIMEVKVVPTEDGALTAASAGERVWRKMYPSMDAASTQAVELQIRRSFVGRGTPLSLSSLNSHSGSITVLEVVKY
jgi:hypothetical protein